MSTKGTKSKQKVDKLNSISRADSLDLLVDYGINLQEKELDVTGDVDEAMYRRISRGLAVLNQINAQKITIVLNTTGGDLFTSLAIYDVIKRNKTKVDILAVGTCQSAGTVILQAANQRLSTPNTSFMVHYGSDHVSADYLNVKRYMEHRDEYEDLIKTIFKDRCGWNDELYEKWNEKDTYLLPNWALHYGLIDKVVE